MIIWLIERGGVWTLTPSTPAEASANIASSDHSAAAYVSLTPRTPPHEIALISSMRSGTWCRCAVAASGATMRASPVELALDSSWAAVTWVVFLQRFSG